MRAACRRAWRCWTTWRVRLLCPGAVLGPSCLPRAPGARPDRLRRRSSLPTGLGEPSSDEALEDDDGTGLSGAAGPPDDDSIQLFEGHTGARAAAPAAAGAAPRAPPRAIAGGCLHVLLAACSRRRGPVAVTRGGTTAGRLDGPPPASPRPPPPRPPDAVLSVAWSPVQADLVASGGQDDRAFLWRVSEPAHLGPAAGGVASRPCQPAAARRRAPQQRAQLVVAPQHHLQLPCA